MAERVVSYGSGLHEMLYDDTEDAPVTLEGEADSRALVTIGGTGQFQPQAIGGGGGLGDVFQSGSVSDNRLARWDGTGAGIKTSLITVSDTGDMTVPGIINAGSTPIDITTAAGYLRVNALNPGAGSIGFIIKHDGVEWTAIDLMVDISDETNLAVTSPIVLTDDTLSHANSGVSAGTYTSVTVDARGHVTAGTNPGGLSGSGTANTIAKWTGASALGNSSITDDGTTVASSAIVDLSGVVNPTRTLQIHRTSSGTSNGNCQVVYSDTFPAFRIRAGTTTLLSIFGNAASTSHPIDIGQAGHILTIRTSTGVNQINFTDTGVVVNEAGENRFFRVEGDANTHLLFCDGATDRVAINESSPAGKLHVNQSSTTAAIPVVYLRQADVDQDFFEFDSTIGTGNAIDTSFGTPIPSHAIKVTITGVGTRYLMTYTWV